MADTQLVQTRQLVDQRQRPTQRYVPIGPVALTASLAQVAVAPSQQMLKVGQLAVCNPTGAAVVLNLTAQAPTGAALDQIKGLSVAANAAIDLTDLIGGLYITGSILRASGAGLVLSGWAEAIL